MLVRFVTWLLVSCGCWLILSPAQAQPLRGTLVLPEGVGTTIDAATEQAADRVEAALRQRSLGVISMHDARDRFVAGSRPPLGAEEGDVDVLAREARAALEHVAFGRTQAAQKSVKEVLTRAERALESLNRETATARQVLDACLALVRTELHRNDRAAALAQAASCRRLVPDVAPNQSLHPASVIGALAEADDQMRRLRTGRLEVTSKPESSCSVYVNGRHLGTTPFVLERAVAGQYRVQVECSAARGRVHMVTLGNTPVELSVDSLLDRAIRSEPRVHLLYASAKQAEPLGNVQAIEVGRAVGAEQVVMLRAAGDDWVLSRLTVGGGRLVGRARVPKRAPMDDDALEAALDQLWEGRIDTPRDAPSVAGPIAKPAPQSAQPSVAEPEPIEPVEVAAAASPPELSANTPPGPSLSTKQWFGLGISVTALGAWTAGVVFEAKAASRDDELASLALSDPRLPAIEKQYDRASGLRWVGLGGALAIAAVPLLARPRAQVPWWGYLITAAGAGVVAVAAVEWARAGECELSSVDGPCIQTRNSEGRAALLLSAGLPLLSVLPMQLWLRRYAKVPVEMSASFDGNVALLRASIDSGAGTW